MRPTSIAGHDSSAASATALRLVTELVIVEPGAASADVLSMSREGVRHLPLPA